MQWCPVSCTRKIQRKLSFVNTVTSYSGVQFQAQEKFKEHSKFCKQCDIIQWCPVSCTRKIQRKLSLVNTVTSYSGVQFHVQERFKENSVL